MEDKITESYVRLHMAELLKAKGFDGLVSRYENEHVGTIICSEPTNCNDPEVMRAMGRVPEENTSLPTYQMVFNWLLYRHKLFISVIPDEEGLAVVIYSVTSKFPYNPFLYNATYTAIANCGHALTPEGAYQVGINYCLKYLI